MQSAPSSPHSLVVPDVSTTHEATPAVKPMDSRGLLLIGLFKLSKAIFFAILGIAALHMVHRSLGDLVLRVTDFLPIDPEGRIVSLLLDKADMIGNHQLREFSLATIGYSVLCLVEGTGLILRKPWAEYFTITLTTMALPWEIFELLRRPTWMRFGLLLVNLAVLAYLLWFLKRSRRLNSRETV